MIAALSRASHDVGVGLVGDDEVLSLEAGAYVVVSEAVFSCCGFTFEW